MTQRELAEAAATSAAAICMYEAGDRVPRTDTLMRLISATGSSLHLFASQPNPIDPAVASRDLLAALELSAALPHQPQATLAAPVFAQLAR